MILANKPCRACKSPTSTLYGVLGDVQFQANQLCFHCAGRLAYFGEVAIYK